MTLQERLREAGLDLSARGWRGSCGSPDCGIASNRANEAALALDANDERIKELEGVLRAACILVNEQANDEGLWFRPDSVIEAYFQQELSRLHEHINRAREALK